jgi:hypothetical protein
MRTLILALSPLLMAGPALGQQTPICDLLKTAIAGNAVINGAAPKVTPANLAWPTGKTSVGGGRYSVVLFEGSPNAADVARMQQALADGQADHRPRWRDRQGNTLLCRRSRPQHLPGVEPGWQVRLGAAHHRRIADEGLPVAHRSVDVVGLRQQVGSA